MKLSDLIPEENTGIALFFSQEQADKVSTAVSESGLSRKIFDYVRAFKIPSHKKEGIQTLPDGFHKELAGIIDEAIPEASLETKVTLFNISEMAFSRTARDYWQKKLSLDDLGPLKDLLNSLFE